MKRLKNNEIDEKIKNALSAKTDGVKADDNTLNKIKEGIYLKQKLNSGGFSMKKKIIAISAACVLCLATVTCIASTRIQSWHSSSYAADEITEFPTAKQLKKKAGFVPKYVESLSDKYSFASVNVAESEGRDSEGNSVVKKKDIYFRYTDKSEDFENNNKTLSVIAENVSEDIFNDGSDETEYDISKYKNIELKYYCFKSVFFPPSYENKDVTAELTEEEKKLNEEGRLNIAYGSSEIQRASHQILCWYDGSTGYKILATDCDISQEEMTEMAKKIIDEK